MAAKTAPSASGATAAVEDYLERIFELVNTKGYARVVDIADRLGISQASVTNMLQRMDAEGLINYEKYRGLTLSPTGRTIAKRIAIRHDVLSEFLRLLGVDEKTITADVEGMEHHISPKTLEAIKHLTEVLRRQPSLLEPAAKSRGDEP